MHAWHLTNHKPLIDTTLVRTRNCAAEEVILCIIHKQVASTIYDDNDSNGSNEPHGTIVAQITYTPMPFDCRDTTTTTTTTMKHKYLRRNRDRCSPQELPTNTPTGSTPMTIASLKPMLVRTTSTRSTGTSNTSTNNERTPLGCCCVYIPPTGYSKDERGWRTSLSCT